MRCAQFPEGHLVYLRDPSLICQLETDPPDAPEISMTTVWDPKPWVCDSANIILDSEPQGTSSYITLLFGCLPQGFHSFLFEVSEPRELPQGGLPLFYVFGTLFCRLSHPGSWKNVFIPGRRREAGMGAAGRREMTFLGRLDEDVAGAWTA